MSVKLIAMGNVLMKDDGVAIEVTRQIEEELTKKGIEVIYGETDFEYCISNVRDNDYLLVLDAAFLGVTPGTITVVSLKKFRIYNKDYTQHSYNFLDLLKIYYPYIEGEVLAIEINEVAFGYGLSVILQENLTNIAKDALFKIEEILVCVCAVHTNLRCKCLETRNKSSAERGKNESGS